MTPSFLPSFLSPLLPMVKVDLKQTPIEWTELCGEFNQLAQTIDILRKIFMHLHKYRGDIIQLLFPKVNTHFINADIFKRGGLLYGLMNCFMFFLKKSRLLDIFRLPKYYFCYSYTNLIPLDSEHSKLLIQKRFSHL